MPRTMSCIEFLDPGLSSDLHTRIYIPRPESSTKPHQPITVIRWIQDAAQAAASGAGGPGVGLGSAMDDLAFACHHLHRGFLMSGGVYTTRIDYLYRVSFAAGEAEGPDRFELEVLLFKPKRGDFELVCERLPVTQAVARLEAAAQLEEQKRAKRRRPPADE